MSGPRTGKSTQPNYEKPGKTVDVYDDLCNVFKKGAIGITCLPLFDTIFTILMPAMKQENMDSVAAPAFSF